MRTMSVRAGRALCAWTLAGVAAGCGGNDRNEGQDGRDRGVLDGQVSDAATDAALDAAPRLDGGRPAGCSADDPEACLYRPAETFRVEVSTFDDLSYTDVIGAQRAVPIAVSRPVGAVGPLPVVVLSHGGADGKTDPRKSMDKWAEALARSGYLAVAVAHAGRDDAAYEAVCAALAVPPAPFQCAIKINWDRPHDVARVLDWLAERNASGPLAGSMDLDHIAHVGHSAGAGAALMLAGATRSFVCAQPFGFNQGTSVPCTPADQVSLAEPRFQAAIGMSPQGPGSDGFVEASYGEVAVPFLMATGTRDGDPGEPESRMSLFDFLPTSADGQGFVRFFIEDEGAKHTLFEAETEACAPISGQARCEQLRTWLFSLAVAFLDRELRGSATAAAWLASDALELASGGDGTLSRR